MLEEKNFSKMKFIGIQILRGIAALLVAFYHIDFIYNTGVNTAIGVDIFFVISGFLIMYTTQSTIKNYAIKRIIRIIPLYWLLTILTYFAANCINGIVPYKPSIEELIKSLFFIPYVRDGIRTDNVIRPIVGPAHTLLSEMFFYLIFWFAAKINHKKRGELVVAIITFLVIIGKVCNIENIPPLIVWTSINMIEFALGVILYFILKKIYNKTNFMMSRSKSILSLIIGIALIIGLIFLPKINFYIKAMISMIIVGNFSIVFFNIKSPIFLEKMGDISYSFYLIHYYVILIFKKMISSMNFIDLKNILSAISAIIVSILLAYFSWCVIEIKFGNYLKKKLIINKNNCKEELNK